MDVKAGSQDHRQNEFYSYRYSTRFQKGDIVEIRTGIDLEVARFQARKSFPDVLNEYWWLKPSDIAALKDISLKISDIYFYHGGVPVLVLISANGSMARKAQIFIKKKDEPRMSIDSQINAEIESLSADDLSELLFDQNLLVSRKSFSVLIEKFPGFFPKEDEAQVLFQIHAGNYDAIPQIGEVAVEHLIERFFVTTHSKETEKIIEAIIAIGQPALNRLEDIAEYLSIMASPFYAKRINWTIEQIKKAIKKSGVLK